MKEFVLMILKFLIFPLAFYTGIERASWWTSEPQTYEFGKYDFYITLSRIADERFKLYFHQDVNEIGNDYIVLEYPMYDFPPTLSIIFSPDKPHRIVLLQYNRVEAIEVHPDKYEIIDSIYMVNPYNGMIRRDTLDVWNNNIIKQYGRNGIRIEANPYMDGFNYYIFSRDSAQEATLVN